VGDTQQLQSKDSLSWWLLRDVFWSPDFVLAAAATLGSWLLVAYNTSIETSPVLVQLLLGFVGVGVAVTAVCLTSVSILVGGLGDRYLQILRHAGGLAAALRPFKLIAVVGTATVVASLVSALAWDGGRLLRPGLFAVPCGLTVWATVGSAQVVFMIIFHGTQRHELEQMVADANRRLKAVGEKKDTA
jgi:MFS family permease